MQIIQPTQNLEQFIKSIQQFTFQQRYFKWISFLQNLKKIQSQYYLASIEKYLEYYPFNHTYWLQLCSIYLSTGKGKAATLKMYQISLTKNPRSITLWKNYLEWLTKVISKSDPNYLRNQYQKATKIIGTHYKASSIYIQYCELQTDEYKKFQIFKKAMVSPLEDADKIYKLFIEFINLLQLDILSVLAEEEKLIIAAQNKKQSIKQQLVAIANRLFQPTKQHVALRYQYQAKIYPEDQYCPYSDSIQNWRSYINFIKVSGNNQFLSATYQRSLIFHCDNELLWQEYFLYLQNQGNHNRALYLLRSHATFFKNLSQQLTYYWIQLEERENPTHARELYLELQQAQYSLEAFIRHIQLELRAKQFQNAKRIYQTVLTVFTANLQIVSFIIIEFAEFMLKYFRDLSFSKRLLKDYFESYPFNEYLFTNYLQFYINHVQYKQNTKDGKQIYDQFVNIILKGLKSVNQGMEKQYARINKVAKNLLRKYIPSIYLLKTAERKIKQMQLALKKEEKALQLTARDYQEEETRLKKIKI